MSNLSYFGINVNFPFEPYEVQKNYIEALIKCLNDRTNSILESPTGTGKTLCLLCGTLAWLDDNKNFALHQQASQGEHTNLHFKTKNHFPKIIYSSRTHSQLSQAVQAMKDTVYKTRKSVILASRDQLCINPEVKGLDTNAAIQTACKNKVSSRSCVYHRQFDKKREQLTKEFMSSSMVDIEDLVKFGERNCCCPYYLTRELQEEAEIVFMPYNYLLDPMIRKNNKIKLEGSVVIFDEAHNIESICEEVSSITLSESLLASAISELKTLGEKLFKEQLDLESLLKVEAEGGALNSNPPNQTEESDGMFQLDKFKKNKKNEDEPNVGVGELVGLKGKLIDLEEKLGELKIPDKNGFSMKGSYLFDFLAKSDITSRTAPRMESILEDLQSLISSSEDLSTRKWFGIDSLRKFISIVFHISDPETPEDVESLSTADLVENTDKYFRVHFKDEVVVREKSVWNQNKAPTTDRTILFCCLYPGKAMKNLYSQQVRSIILTSGTLYPIDSLKLELGLAFPITLQNGHVINHDQVKIMILTKGPDGRALNSSYQTRNSIDYLQSLGNTVLNIAKEVPRGVLVFFPSYDLMNKCLENWKQTGLYDKMISYKKLFPEPKNKMQFNSLIFEYKKCCLDPDDTRGGMLIAVMRGRASEGLDMSDHTSRAVLVIGLPYPPIFDAKVKMKMSYLDEMTRDPRNNFKLAGSQWYKMQAWKAINQAIGRVIRHRTDFGVVVLCDERFASNESRQHLPSWIRSSFEVFSECDKASMALRNFFFNAELKYPSPPLGLLALEKEEKKSKTTTSQSFRLPVKISDKESANEDGPSSLDVMSIYSTGSADLVSKRNLTNKKVFQMLDDMKFKGSQGSANTPKKASNQPNIEEVFSQASLLASQQKKLKLEEERKDTLADNKPLNDYFKRVKDTLREAKQEQSNDALKKFSNSLKEFWGNYKFFKDDAEKVSSLTLQLFSNLTEVFFEIEQPGLLSELVQFLPTRPVQEQFDKLIFDLTGLSGLDKKTDPSLASKDADKENINSCVKCYLPQARIPLVSTCKHVACLDCWKEVFDKGAKLCPKCHESLKKKDLKRLLD